MRANARTLVRLTVTGLLAVTLWLLFHTQIAAALRDLTVVIGRFAGVELLVSGSTAAGSRQLREDEIGILATTNREGRTRVNRYVMTLTRWHANLVVLPPLALSVGRPASPVVCCCSPSGCRRFSFSTPSPRSPT
jgi:hypothetical protein